MSNDASNKGKGLLGGLASHAAAGGGIAGGMPPAAGGLASVLWPNDLFSRRKVDGLYFNSKKIILDGYSFIGCRFDNCTLSVSTTNFDLTNCIIDDSCRIEYGNEVTKIIQLFNSRYQRAYEFFAPPFVPLRNPDGSITIKPGQ